MIADDLLRIFPESPVIALWRNPLSIIASIMSTWGGGGGRWNLQHFRLDLFEALPKMIETVSANPERIHALRYEDLVREPETTLGAIFDHIGVPPDPTVLERFATLELAGRVQDPNVSTASFAHLRADRVDRWATILSNPLRKAWCRRYLRWLGRERLATMGYDLDRTLDELATVRPTSRFLATDVILAPGDALYRTFELGLFAKKLRDRRAGRPLLAHK
jgi:hypothetical protein